jgi:hypothetical protein
MLAAAQRTPNVGSVNPRARWCRTASGQCRNGLCTSCDVDCAAGQRCQAGQCVCDATSCATGCGGGVACQAPQVCGQLFEHAGHGCCYPDRTPGVCTLANYTSVCCAGAQGVTPRQDMLDTCVHSGVAA